MKIALASLMMMVIQAFGQNFKWNKIEVEGVSYVSMAELAKFYRFGEPKVAGKRVTLRNKDVTMAFESGTKKASFNEVGFLFGQEILKKGGGHFVSTSDLTLIIDPVLRPAQVRGLGEFDTVLFKFDLPEGYSEGDHLEGEVSEKIMAMGFKVVVLKSEAELEKFQELAKDGSSVYLEISFRQGDEGNLKTRSVGGLTKPGLALATGIHWVTLNGLERGEIIEVEDGRIAHGEGPVLEKLKFPGCRVELTMDFSKKTATKVDLKKLHQSMVRSIAQALVFARKAASRRTQDKVKEAAAEEK